MLKFAILLVLFHSSTAERDTTPVFLIDFEKILSRVIINPNPLAKLKSADFAKIIEETEKRTHVVILFIEESFCFEDISLKDRYGTPFYHLSQALKGGRAKFIPAVSQPFQTLKKHFRPETYNVFYINDLTNKFKIYDGQLKYFYIYFKDNVNETRGTALRRHDLLMREVYTVIRQIAMSPIVAFYTGKVNPIVVEKMNFVPVKTQKLYQHPGVTIESGGALFKFIGVYSTVGTRRSSFSQIPMITDETWATRRLNTRMAYSDFEFEFSFQFKEDRWLIEKVLLLEWGEEVGNMDLNVGAPWNWSYMCSDPLILINMRDGSSVTISHYQVQPFLNAPEVSRAQGNHCFGPPIHCGPYFNSQILACLMVAFICLGILMYGVISMYNCNSNDRYDDASQKPLVIAMEGGMH